MVCICWSRVRLLLQTMSLFKFFFSSAFQPSEPMVNTCTSENCGNLQHDLQMLRNERLKFNKNPLVGHLNVNSLRNKIIDLREIIQYLNLDYSVLSET